MPVVRKWTPIAPMKTQRIRLTMRRPAMPRKRLMYGDSWKRTQDTANTAVMAVTVTTSPSRSRRRIPVTIEPGPTRRGTAMGTTPIWRMLRASSASTSGRGGGNTMYRTARTVRITPPAMRNSSMLIWKTAVIIQLPARDMTRSVPYPAPTATLKREIRVRRSRSSVKSAKMATFPIGLIIAKRARNALSQVLEITV